MDRSVIGVVVAVALAIAGCEKKTPRRQGEPERIITLTPSATRLVIAVGARDRLVATDKYSEVEGLPEVGDFLAPNVEVIAKLQPDLVVCDAVQSKAAASLRGLGIEVLSIEMHSIADILRELVAVAAAVGEPERGQAVRQRIDAALETARQRAAARRERPRVLWVMDRRPGAIAEIVAAGPGSFAAELLALVGAGNAVTGSVRYPKLSRETLVKIDPDLIIDASAAAGDSTEAWRQTGWRVVAASTDLATPGPGIDKAVAEVERLVFGE